MNFRHFTLIILSMIILLILARIFFVGNPSIFQVFVGDSILSVKANKIIDTQIQKSKNFTIADSIKFDNIYLWNLKTGNKTIQVRVLPRYFLNETSFVITKINDEKATPECIREESSITLNGIIGNKDSHFAKKTGIIFDSVQTIENNLVDIIREINTWPTIKDYTARTSDTSVLYNCEIRFLN